MKEGFLSFEKSVRIEPGKTVKASPKLVAVPPPAPSTSAAPASASAEPVVPIGKRWWVEGRGGFAKLVGGEFQPAEMDPKVLGDFAASGGYRLSRQWSVLGAAGLHPPSTFEGSFGATPVTLEASGFRVSVAAAWSPLGNPYVSIAPELGVVAVNVHVQFPGTPYSGGQTRNALLYGAELRVDVPLGASWFVGARAGAKIAFLGFDLRVTSGANIARVANDKIFLPVNLAVGYRF
jgi:hypothetical protein